MNPVPKSTSCKWRVVFMLGFAGLIAEQGRWPAKVENRCEAIGLGGVIWLVSAARRIGAIVLANGHGKVSAEGVR